MPFDKKGSFHMNTQRAMASDKMGGSANKHKQSGEPSPGVADHTPDEDQGDSTRTIITHNDDGTHSVMHHDGEETGPHMDMQEALDAIHAKHGGDMGEELAEEGMMKHHMPEHALSGM